MNMTPVIPRAQLIERAGRVLREATVPELPGHYRGKVRDNYDLTDGRRVLIATDRLSAFDRILCSVPFKGQVLTQTARYWFERTADICPNHVLDYLDPNVVIGQRLKILPVEIVVRGFLAGTTGTSVLTMYKAGQRDVYGIRLPEGLRDNQRLPTPILTPTSKAGDGDHDQPLTPRQIIERGMLSLDQWEELQAYAFALFARGQAMALDHGLILADTKYEFGVDAGGRIILADEIHTPDSSRYWLADSYEARFSAEERPDSFDKDFVRSWVANRCNPYRDPIPKIPEELILSTAEIYLRAYEAITAQPFVFPEDIDPFDRIHSRLTPLF